MIAYAGAQRLAARTHPASDLAFTVKPRWDLATLEGA